MMYFFYLFIYLLIIIIIIIGFIFILTTMGLIMPWWMEGGADGCE
jgi:hypothetical protein